MIVELLLLAIVWLMYWHYKTRLPSDYPPSPPLRLPILGHIHYLWLHRANINEGIDSLYEKYNRNGVFALHLGPTKLIIVGEKPTASTFSPYSS
jgi:hypothetical protein